MIALLVITDGRKDCIAQTVPSALDNLKGDIDEWWMYDDSGDAAHRQWLADRFPQFEVIWHPDGRQGFGGAIRAAWAHLAQHSLADHVFHLEDDFTFNRPVPCGEMTEILNRHNTLGQVALRRQPWNDIERSAGGVIEANQGAYSEQRGSIASWLEHDLFWTTNPSIYRRSLIDTVEWPTGAHTEGRFTIAMRELGYRFAYLGERSDPPWVHHIGNERIGTGY